MLLRYAIDARRLMPPLAFRYAIAATLLITITP